MTKGEMVKLLKTDVKKWNKWRKDNPDVKIDLTGADLKYKNLTGVDLSGAKLEGTDLGLVYLEEANLEGADLYETDLTRANLKGADLSYANLECIKICETNLNNVRIRYNGKAIKIKFVELEEEEKKTAMTNNIKINGHELNCYNCQGTDNIFFTICTKCYKDLECSKNLYEHMQDFKKTMMKKVKAEYIIEGNITSVDTEKKCFKMMGTDKIQNGIFTFEFNFNQVPENHRDKIKTGNKIRYMICSTVEED